MQIRYLLTISLLAGGVYAGQQDYASDIPENEREAYRKCVIASVSNNLSMSHGVYTAWNYMAKIFDGDDQNLEKSATSGLQASTLLYTYTNQDPELAAQPEGYCENLLHQHRKQVRPGALEKRYEDSAYHHAIERRTYNRINALSEKFKRNREIREVIFPKTADELQYYFNNVTSEEADKLHNELKDNLRHINELAHKRIDVNESKESKNTDDA